MGFYATFPDGPILAAHRGRRELRPENTLCAFEAALGHCDLIELDVQLSRDKEWIVCHDPTLERTTDIEKRLPGHFRPHRLIEYSFDTLRSLDAGSWFLERDPFGALRSGKVRPEEIEALLPQRLPSLAEALRFGTEHKIPLNVEIKDMPTYTVEEVIRSFLAELKRIPHPPLLISSFNHRYLRRLHREAPRLPLAALVEAVHPPRLISYLKALGVEAYHVDLSLASTTPVELLGAHGISCGIYVINDPKERKAWESKGFRLFFADRL